MSGRAVALRAAAVLVSLALVAWLVADGRWQGVGVRLRRIDGLALLGVALLFAASYAMRGARIHGEFRDELAATPGRSAYLRILRLTLVHNALVNVLPFRSGEVAFPLLLTRWFGIGTGRAIVSLLWLRAQDATVVVALAALAWPSLAWEWRVLAIVAIVAGAWLLPRWVRAARPASTSRWQRLQGLLERATRRNAAGWAWTLGNWSVKLLAEAWLVALALWPDEGGSGPVALLGAVGAELVAILPIQGVAGFGTFEAGGAALMRTQGVALANGLEAVLVLHAVVLTLALVAGGLAAAFLPGPAEGVGP